jgi:hypothetical protein
VQALYGLAARHTFITGPGGDPFLVALVARAEVGLGLSAATAALPPANNLLTPTWLWEMRFLRNQSDTPRHPTVLSLAGRQQVWAFLDYVLRGQPVEADGQLLRTLNRARSVQDWLAEALETEAAEEALAKWAAALNEAYANEAGNAPEAEGLYYGCEQAIYRVSGGSASLVEDGVQVFGGFGTLAASGGYVAYLHSVLGGDQELGLVGPGGAETRTVASGGGIMLLGWSSAGQLLYIQQQEEPGATLFRYDPGTDRSEALFEQVSVSGLAFFPSWSADRTAVGVSRVRPNSPGEGVTAVPMVVRVVDPVSAVILGAAGSGTWLSPDGQYAAYMTGSPGTAEGEAARTTIVRVVALDQPDRVVAEGVHTFTEDAAGGLGLLLWTPDSRAIIYSNFYGENEAKAYQLSLDGGTLEPLTDDAARGPYLPLGFSADGQYLALAYLGDEGVARLSVRAWPTGPTHDYAPVGGLNGFAWSPAGHVLALPLSGGVYATDPESGAGTWVAMGECAVAGW